MKLLTIVGSRNPDGQTARAAQALDAGAREAGMQTDTVFLTELNLERCRQCEADGWGICKSEGACVIEDDFAGLVGKIETADVVSVATPVYFSDLSESCRGFLDRLRRTAMHEDGKAKLAGKAAVGVCVAGGGGGGAPPCCVSLEKVLNTCGFNVVDMVPVRRQNLEMKCSVLKTVGAWLATA
jgi:multimeric flavodoxin WrbA